MYVFTWPLLNLIYSLNAEYSDILWLYLGTNNKVLTLWNQDKDN